MGSREGDSRRLEDHHEEEDSRHLFVRGVGRWDSQTDLVQKCSFLERILQK